MADQRYFGYSCMYLKDLDPLLKSNIQQKQEFDLTKTISYVYVSVHLESTGLFNIHPETVSVNEWGKGGKSAHMWWLLFCNQNQEENSKVCPCAGRWNI